MSVLLALDVATICGFAVGEIGTENPRTALELATSGGIPQPLSGTHRIGRPGIPDGQFYANYEQWVDDLITIHNPAMVVYEAPFISGGNKMHAAFRLLGMSAITDLICYKKSVPVRSAHNATVRKYFCGTGNAKREIMKQKIKDACDLRGWKYEDDNHADALAVWEYSQALLLGVIK